MGWDLYWADRAPQSAAENRRLMWGDDGIDARAMVGLEGDIRGYVSPAHKPRGRYRVLITGVVKCPPKDVGPEGP